MTTFPPDPALTGTFALVHRQVTGVPKLNPAALVIPGTEGHEPLSLSPAEARGRLYGAERDVAVNREIWRQTARLARQEAQEAQGTPAPGRGPVSGWQVVLLWLAVPRIRSTVSRLRWNFGLDQADLESAASLGLLERLATVDLEEARIDNLLVMSAIRHCWALLPATRRERAVSDIAAAVDSRQACPDPVDELAWELSINPPSRPEGLGAQLRFTASRESVEGARLGALAERLGLREVVHRARRPKVGPPVGRLSLRPSEGHR